MAGKRLELLKEAVSRASHVAVLWNAGYPGKEVAFAETESAARVLGVRILSLEVRHAQDLPGTFAAIARANPDALISFSDPLAHSQAKVIADFAARSRLPMISEVRAFADEGGLMTYGPNSVDPFRLASGAGRRPGSFPDPDNRYSRARGSTGLPADADDLSGPDGRDVLKHRRDERNEMRHAVGGREDEKDAEGQRGDVLLKLEILVHREEDVIVAAHALQQRAVLQTGPAAPDNGVHRVALE